MRAVDFLDASPGHLVPTEQGALAYVPDPPPRLIALDDETIFLLDQASRAVAQLSGAGETLPNPYLLIEPFLRREAVLSSRIEGTQASLPDVYVFEAAGEARTPDTREVMNYVRAMGEGQEQLRTLPISTRLLRALHATLMDGVRGDDKRPGDLRDRQVWIGSAGTPIENARFVPPPHRLVPDLLSDWERFVHAEDPMPPLVRCALMHYQFETIHPFNDGNGRIGRLLIPLLLIERDVMAQPLLYVSAFFERERAAYYQHLYAVSTEGAWIPWLRFFLRAVLETAQDASRRVRDLRALTESYRIRTLEVRASANATRLADELTFWPIVSTPLVARELNVTPAGARLIIEKLREAGILTPMGDGRPQLYAAREILELLE